jgi:hypothetical protein
MRKSTKAEYGPQGREMIHSLVEEAQQAREELMKKLPLNHTLPCHTSTPTASCRLYATTFSLTPWETRAPLKS